MAYLRVIRAVFYELRRHFVCVRRCVGVSEAARVGGDTGVKKRSGPLGEFSVKKALDDAVNYIPSRMSAVGMIAAAWMTGFDAKNAYRIWKRDRRNHASPNSAQTESVCAGALHVQLAGPASYFGKLVQKPTIGDADRKIERADVSRSCKLLYGTSILWLVVLETIALTGGFLL